MSASTSATPTLVEFNLSSNFPIKLDNKNYPTWYKLFMNLLAANNLVGYVTGSTPCPSSSIGDKDAQTDNPDYLHWCRQDSHITIALMASCGPEAQIVIVSATSSADAWTKLKKAYANSSRARIMSLKERLATVLKGSSSVHDYLRTIRSIGDELALIGHPIDDLDLVISTINGLGPTFHEFSTSIRTRDTPLQFDELFDKLVDFEIYLQRDEQNTVSVPITANIAHRNHAPSNRLNQHQSQFRKPLSSTPDITRPVQTCQYCNKRGHTAKTCYNLHGYPNKISAKPRIHHVQKQNPPDFSSSWLLDSGASHHVTNDLANLKLAKKVIEPDRLLVADGNPLSILHNGLHSSFKVSN
ncbi:hypothetical protein TSUD_27900 [Trifolium subterraneum]|uniref:Retrotransposon Copia-like N-terminal domain-containing protein n=1 Tax=Trifolium subterraneum TaxID=3900 RepID=A0A2Z6PGU6_TRISU|nr:hypothetical protein TSUD_27900 [Trifolium subterraneum]